MRQHIVLAAALALAPHVARAEPLSKEACVDAHSRGQDAKEQGKLTLARKLFLSCAQSSCPTAVQSDCARFADDLSSLQPTVNFVARDGNGNDLPNTSIYVDGQLVATVIDGKPVEIDPGSHSVKFTNAGRDEMVTVVIGQGEKGRVVQARFAATGGAALVGADKPSTRHRSATPVHPTGATVLAIGGGVLMLGGGAIAFYGKSQVPSQCSLSTHECAAPPGDPVFAKAADGARTMDIGIALAGVGVAALAGGLVWYFAGAKTTEAPPVQAWLGSTGGGVALSGRF